MLVQLLSPAPKNDLSKTAGMQCPANNINDSKSECSPWFPSCCMVAICKACLEQVFFSRLLVNSKSLTQELPDSHRWMPFTASAGWILRKSTYGRCSILCTISERVKQFSVESVIPQERTVIGNRQGMQLSCSKFVVTISINQLSSWHMTECHLNT